MKAKVVKFQIKQGRCNEVIRLFEEFVVPGAKKQKGFMAGMLLTEPNTENATSIALWETEADIRASEASGYYKAWVEKLSDLLSRVPSREIYEVRNLANLSIKSLESGHILEVRQAETLKHGQVSLCECE